LNLAGVAVAGRKPSGVEVVVGHSIAGAETGIGGGASGEDYGEPVQASLVNNNPFLLSLSRSRRANLVKRFKRNLAVVTGR